MLVPVCLASLPIAIRPVRSIVLLPSKKKRLSLELLQSLSCSQTWRKGGRPVASLEIKTADELIALDVEGRGRTRRAGRETLASRRILRMFLDRGGPIPVDEIVAAFQDGTGDPIHQALAALDNDDLILIRDGQVTDAYQFCTVLSSVL